MQWTKPDFQEISLNMEVTAYVNTDGEVRKGAETNRRTDENPNADEPRAE